MDRIRVEGFRARVGLRKIMCNKEQVIKSDWREWGGRGVRELVVGKSANYEEKGTDLY